MEMREVNRNVIEEYRANNGKLSGMFEKSRLVLLSTTGAKSGQKRTTPLGYLTLDGDVVVIASNMGAEKHPAWFLNLTANPDVTVELPGETYQARAVILTGAEHDAMWARVIEQMPFFVAHQQKTSRQIPVVVLKRNEG